MKIQFIDKKFRPETLRLIETANSIITEYERAGFRMTLRQLYYQLVAREHIPNRMSEYKRLVNIMADARMSGLVSWEAIEDRTRNLRGITHWRDPEEIMRAAINSYRIDMWENQPFYPEVWVEKEALAGVISAICAPVDVNYFCCRGYASLSEMWTAGYRRLASRMDIGQTPVIIYLGDHDPSGVDMSRDVEERLSTFAGTPITVVRAALNMDQVKQFNLPPNPAKTTDSRSGGYIAEHGRGSWELDALNPQALGEIIMAEIGQLMDTDLWDESVQRQRGDQERLRQMLERD